MLYRRATAATTHASTVAPFKTPTPPLSSDVPESPWTRSTAARCSRAFGRVPAPIPPIFAVRAELDDVVEQRLPLEPLHRDRDRAILRVRVDDRADVRVPQRLERRDLLVHAAHVLERALVEDLRRARSRRAFCSSARPRARARTRALTATFSPSLRRTPATTCAARARRQAWRQAPA